MLAFLQLSIIDVKNAGMMAGGYFKRQILGSIPVWESITKRGAVAVVVCDW